MEEISMDSIPFEEALSHLPTQSEMDVYVLTTMLGAKEARKTARRMFDIMKTFSKDDWRMLGILQVHGIGKTNKMIREADKKIKDEEKEDHDEFMKDLAYQNIRTVEE